MRVGKGDVVIVVGFRGRVSAFGDIMRFMPTTSATTILIADSTASYDALFSDFRVECPMDSVGSFDSYTAAMSAATQITDALLEHLCSKGKRGVMQIASSFELLGEIDQGDVAR